MLHCTRLKFLGLFFISAFAIIVYGNNIDQKEIERLKENEHCAWNLGEGVYSLSFSDLTFKVDVSVSGRIVSFQKNQKEILAQPAVHSFNYGSTFWPGPQSNWGWPPYPALDGEPYEAVLVGDTLKTQSKDDPQSGFRFSKYFIPDVENKSIEIQYQIKNISNKPIAVDPWEVTRAASMGLSFFPEGETEPLEKSNLSNVKMEDGMVWYFCDTTLFTKSQKIFTSAKEGWLAHCANGLLFVKVFPDIKPNTTSPGQEEVEIFAHENKKYIELENHGEQKALLPGQSLKYTVRWYLMELPSSVKTEPGNKDLVRLVRKMISGNK